MNPINKIIEVLKNTNLGFTVFDLKEKGKCKYCAEGVLLKGIVPAKSLEVNYSNIIEVCVWKA